MIEHDGVKIPESSTSWDPDGTEWITFAWDDQVAIHGAIQSSEWVLPDGWTSANEREDVSVETLDGTIYDHAVQALISGSETSSGVTITNRATFADGTVLDRSVKLRVQKT